MSPQGSETISVGVGKPEAGDNDDAEDKSEISEDGDGDSELAVVGAADPAEAERELGEGSAAHIGRARTDTS